ncbi:MAG: hypothetical protein ACXV7F_07305 [Methylomonas sp.]
MRQFLVVLLVLLQFAAPMVHAHAGGNVTQRGLHLHEFESLRLITDSPSLASADHSVNMQSCIVEVGSAIKQQQTLDQAVTFFYPVNDALGFAIARDARIVNFSPHNAGFIPKPVITHNTSRAPPL